jgi:hypothetical protein
MQSLTSVNSEFSAHESELYAIAQAARSYLLNGETQDQPPLTSCEIRGGRGGTKARVSLSFSPGNQHSATAPYSTTTGH